MDPYFTLYIKVNSERTRDLNVKAKTIKLIEKNIGVKHGFEFGSRFLDMTPKAQLTKEEIEKLNFMSIENFYMSKGTINSKKIAHGWENIFTNHI